VRWSGLLVLLVLPTAAAQPLLVGVAPDLPGAYPGDEGFAVGCVGSCALDGWRVTDGEATWTFPAGAAQMGDGQTLWVAGDLTTWGHFGGPPAIALATGASSGQLKLGNGGDSLQLLDPDGHAVDAFAWGDKTVEGLSGAVQATSPGLVYTRDRVDGRWVDTDRAADWVTPRLHRIGESSLDQPTWHPQRLTLYSSPDSSFGVLTDLVAAATRRLHLHVYELRSAGLVDALVTAKQAHPDLDLQVLVDGDPVGQSASEKHATTDALRRVTAAGGHAWIAGDGRYDDWHLKILVADDAVAVQSENWVDTGVPQDPSSGNRGWGAVVPDKAVADWFAAWMAEDRASWDVELFNQTRFDPLFTGWDHPAAARSGDYGPVVAAVTLDGPFTVTPLVAPEHTQDPRRDPLAALVASAKTRVEAQQLDLATGAKNGLGWSGPDPLVASLQDASHRGLAVRVQTAPPFSSGDAGNQPALDALAAAGAATSTLDRPGITTLHNKGLLVDDTVVLGSMNGNHHSRSANREVDLVIQGPGAAAFFRALFESDWKGATAGPDTGAVGRDLHGIPPAPVPTLFVFLLVVAAGRRCSARSRSPPSP
jgi:hypothetical protein